jgi:hypothetical protein
MRESLFAAALQEILDHHVLGKNFDPITDHRFRWAVQYLEVIERSRKAIDEDIRLHASLAFDPTPFLSRKDLSAGAA